MLVVKDINVYYDAIHALKDVSFEVKEGEIVSLIGANGAGKTTILHTISGLIRAKSGSISFLGKQIEKTEAHHILRMGLSQVPEGRRTFQQMSVLENLEMGAYARKDTSSLGKEMEDVFNLFPRLRERKTQAAGTLSGGEQQMLAMGRALMSRPKLLMLDEPSMGLSPILVGEIFDIIKNLYENGTTILLVEQNARMALSIATRGYVLETGRVVTTAPAAALLKDPAVRKAYLGG